MHLEARRKSRTLTLVLKHIISTTNISLAWTWFRQAKTPLPGRRGGYYYVRTLEPVRSWCSEAVISMAILTLWSNEAVDTTYENTRTVKRLTLKCRYLVGHTMFLITRRSRHHRRSTPTSPRCHYPWTAISLANSFPPSDKVAEITTMVCEILSAIQ
jgi:hypothetical protein